MPFVPLPVVVTPPAREGLLLRQPSATATLTPPPRLHRWAGACFGLLTLALPPLGQAAWASAPLPQTLPPPLLESPASHPRRDPTAIVTARRPLPVQSPSQSAPRTDPTPPPAATADPAGAAIGQFTPGPCRFFVPPGLKLPQGELRCGTVSVPERHATPNGKLIRLGVAWLKSNQPNPAAEPLVLAQGGPGGSMIELLPGFAPALERAGLRDRDLIFFDQRGTRFSEPFLFCQELYDFKVNRAAEPDSEALREAYRAEVGRCHDRLSQSGIDLGAYNSLENAADVPLVVSALGYTGQYDFYGVSYGSALGQHLMRDRPERLRSVVLDAVVPLEKSFLADIPQNADRALQKFFAACQANAECAATYPTLEQEFLAAIARLNAQPETVTLPNLGALQAALEGGTSPQALDPSKFFVPVWLNGDGLMASLNAAFYSSDLLPKLPQAIHEANQGNYALAMQIVPVLLFNQSQAEGMYNSVICAEDGRFSLDAVKTDGINPALVTALRDSPAEILKTCQRWPVPAITPQSEIPVKSPIPTLLLSGEFDQIAPPSFADLVAAHLPNSQRFTFPGLGHAALGSNDCPGKIMAAFLRAPTQAPDASCVAEMGLKFELPMPIATEPARDTISQFRTAVPKSWQRQALPVPVWGEVGPLGQSTGRSLVIFPLGNVDPAPLLNSLPQKMRSVGQRRFANRPWQIFQAENPAIASAVATTRGPAGSFMVIVDSDSAWHRDAVMEAALANFAFDRGPQGSPPGP